MSLRNSIGQVRPRHKAKSRTVAFLTGVLLVAGLAVFDAAPASAAVPGAPRPIVAVGYKAGIRVYWAPPLNIGGKPISGYTVQRSFLGNEIVQASYDVKTNTMLSDKSTENAVGYRYRIKARNADGTGPWSPWFEGRKVSDRLDLQKWRSKEDFVTRQYLDFFDSAPSAQAVTQGVSALSNSSDTPSSFLGKLITNPLRTEVRHPVIRLYATYFRRSPDHGGLSYWAGRRRSGASTLDDVSTSFAKSSEFKRTYGALSNAAFVDLVYRNVLGRSAESNGGAFWRGQLASGATTRGRMMTQFSESAEFVRVNANDVLVTDVHDDMLESAISKADKTLWAAFVAANGKIGDYATYLITLDEYPRNR